MLADEQKMQMQKNILLVTKEDGEHQHFLRWLEKLDPYLLYPQCLIYEKYHNPSFVALFPFFYLVTNCNVVVFIIKISTDDSLF